MDARAIAALYLENCSESELVAFLEPLLARRAPFPGGTWAQHRICLALATRVALDDAPTTLGSAEVELLGNPDPSSYPNGFAGEPFCQSGSCPECGVALRGQAKRTLCAVCKTVANLT